MYLSRLRSAQVILIWNLFVLSLSVARGGPDNWGRGFIATPPNRPRPFMFLQFSFLNCVDGHLVGEFDLVNASNSQLLLEGTKTSDEKFWPFAVAQIASGLTEKEWKWRTIAKLSHPGEKVVAAVKVTTAWSSSKELNVDLDAFKPYIGKATFGRIVLPGGQWSMFELEKLLPLASER